MQVYLLAEGHKQSLVLHYISKQKMEQDESQMFFIWNAILIQFYVGIV